MAPITAFMGAYWLPTPKVGELAPMHGLHLPVEARERVEDDARLDDMYKWHRARGIQAMHGSGRREDGRDYVRWCFAGSDAAAAFADEFKK